MIDKKPFDSTEFHRQMIARLIESSNDMDGKIKYLMRQVSLLKSVIGELLEERMINETS